MTRDEIIDRRDALEDIMTTLQTAMKDLSAQGCTMEADMADEIVIDLKNRIALCNEEIIRREEEGE